MSLIKQSHLLHTLLPEIKTQGAVYKKYKTVEARLANVGEVIRSVTQSGEETVNTAKANDVVVRNDTQAQEQYLVGMDKFKQRYVVDNAVTENWQVYKPNGSVQALEITQALLHFLQVDEPFSIEAPWGTEQYAEMGDFLAAPLPDVNEIYRIGRAEFDATYKKA